MAAKLNCIMLIDDNKHDNFFHEFIIKDGNYADVIITKESAIDALDYLVKRKETGGPQPDLIFLDINMPRMNVWEFLEEYEKLDKELQGKVIVIMLTTNESSPDKVKAVSKDINPAFKIKPVNEPMLDELIATYFS